MKNIKKLLVLLMAMVMVMCTLCACGGSEDSDSKDGDKKESVKEDTLEYFYTVKAKAQFDATLEAQKSQASDQFKDIYAEFDGNKMTSVYVFRNHVEESEWAANEATMQQNFDAQKDYVIQSVRTESGVTDSITIVYRYLNDDNSLLGEFTMQD